MDHTPEHIWLLIARKLSGEATADELLELDEMLRLYPNAGYSKEVLHDLWQSQPNAESQYSETRYKDLVQQIKNMGIDEGKFTLDNHFINSEEELPKASSKTAWTIALCTTAFLAVIAIIYYLPGVSTNKELLNAQARNEITTKNGSKTSVVLPDGTKVWLNSGSQLNYDKNYGNKLREVSLVGEAYFDVVKNPDRPFLIHTRKMDIKVTGTAFNVKCYPGEKTTETSLVRGSIEVTLKDRQEKIMLKANEKLIISNEEIGKPNSVAALKPTKAVLDEKPIIALSHLTLLPLDNTVVETAWVQNRLVFNGETFEEVAAKMERWYNVDIEFANDKLKGKILTGNFEKETVQEALNALRLVFPFYSKIKSNRILIYNDEKEIKGK